MAKDKYHNLVKNGLISQGWTITDDPLYLDLFTTTLQVDLGAERLIGATNGIEQIAVEIKSFIGLSRVSDFYKALGQFSYYSLALEQEEPERALYLAIPQAYKDLIKEPITTELIRRYQIKFVIYDINKKTIVKWIK